MGHVAVRLTELREDLLQHIDQAARPVLAYPQFDKISTAWKLALPGPTMGMSSPVFKEVMAQLLCFPLAWSSIVGQRVGATGVFGLFGDKIMTATLQKDTWKTRHDSLKVVNGQYEASILERLDRRHHGAQPEETGRLAVSYGQLQCDFAFCSILSSPM